VRAQGVQAVFQQRGHVTLNSLELVQAQVRIGYGEHVAGPGLLVNKHALAIVDDLSFTFSTRLRSSMTARM